MKIISKNSKLNLLFKAYGYWLFKKKLSKTQYQTTEQFKNFQLAELKKTLKAAKDVPYYQALFKQINFDPERDFKQLSDLEKIPVLTKEIIRKEYKNLINPKYSGYAIEYATSGSTGEPQKMLLTPYMVAIDKAMIFRHHSWSTNKARPIIFSLRSYVLKDPNAPLFKYSSVEKTYYFSAYNLNHSNAAYYIQELKKINPDILRGYPSSISFLCDYLTAADVQQLTNLKGIYTSSETLSDEERNKIERLFGKRLFNWYGMTEPAIIIKEGPEHDGMHLCLEYGYPEYGDTDAPNVKKLITTSFYNSVMPFIRYDTGDLVELADHTTANSAIKLPVVKTVLGRKDDFIVGLNGAKLPSINFYTLFREFTKIKAFQIVQYSTLEVLVLIRTIEKLSEEEMAALRKGMELRIGPGINISIEEREKFFTNADGKTLVVVKKPGSYKLASYDAYSLSTQKAWENYRKNTVSYKLDWNEADEVANQEVLDFITSLYKKDNLLKWYPEADHKMLMEKLRDFNKLDSTKQLLLGHGSDNVLRMILQVFTSNSRCMVLLPTYDNFRAQAESFGNTVVGISIGDSTDTSITTIVNEIVTTQPRLIYITNPNNPIGYQIENDGLKKILAAAKSINSLVIVDEAYYEFSRESALPLLKDFNNLLIIRTFSKAFGLAGIRLGYLIANEEIVDELKKVYNPKDVTMLSAAVGEYMLNNFDKIDRYVDEVNSNKEVFYNYCKQNNIKYYPSKANFVSYEVDNVNSYIQFMADNKVYLRDRKSYFKGEFVRATIGAAESFNAFLTADKAYRAKVAVATT
ncbi:MAG: aminotransferase class I/II-fold pyridoxal phosphate-dependent enzyme [Bacteroidetes bacterium]|nr:aminotransferase class I/II-fold pyridoxal phosphate-dependent enzyme [Bacteroidota bacterium]